MERKRQIKTTDIHLVGVVQLEDDHPGQSNGTGPYPDENDDLAAGGRAETSFPGPADRVAALDSNGDQCVDAGTHRHALQVRKQLANDGTQDPSCFVRHTIACK